MLRELHYALRLKPVSTTQLCYMGDILRDLTNLDDSVSVSMKFKRFVVSENKEAFRRRIDNSKGRDILEFMEKEIIPYQYKFEHDAWVSLTSGVIARSACKKQEFRGVGSPVRVLDIDFIPKRYGWDGSYRNNFMRFTAWYKTTSGEKLGLREKEELPFRTSVTPVGIAVGFK